MALPLLPSAEIPSTQFTRLQKQAINDPLQQLFDYVESTWILSTVWPPSSWSAFRCPIRTNNDVEGWHYRLNRRARSRHLSLYILIALLHNESQLCSVHLKLVSDGKLTRSQKKNTQNCIVDSTHCGPSLNAGLPVSLVTNCWNHVLTSMHVRNKLVSVVTTHTYIYICVPTYIHVHINEFSYCLYVVIWLWVSQKTSLVLGTP